MTDQQSVNPTVNPPVTPPVTGAGGWLSSERLASTVTWAGTGFSLVGVILGFFGIREASLHQLLRANAGSALVVFCLLGAGLLLSLVAPALSGDKEASVWPVIAAIVVTGTALSLLFTDVPVVRLGNLLTVGVLVAGLALAWYAAHRRWALPLLALGAALAVSATSFGLYGTAKLSLLYNRSAVGTQVTAAISGTAEAAAVDVHVSAVGLDGRALAVQVYGSQTTPATHGPETLLGQQVLRPDVSGDLTGELAFPVTLSQWRFVFVRARTEALAPELTPRAMERGTLVAVLHGTLRAPRLTGTLVPDVDGKHVTAQVSGVGIAPTGTVEIVLDRAPSSGRVARLASATLSAADDGTLSWTFPMATPRRGSGTLRLWTMTCSWPVTAAPPPEQTGRRCTTSSLVASYRTP